MVRYVTTCPFLKFTLEQATKAQKGSSSTLSSTSALDGVGGQRHGPVALPTGNRTGTHCIRRLFRPQGRSGRMRKISIQPGFDPRTFQNVTCPYIDWVTSAPTYPLLQR